MKVVIVMMLMLMFIVLTVDGQDDMGADLDMESMAGGDADSNAIAEDDVEKEKSLIEQTSLAIQQFSIIIGMFMKY
jgi:hypothetical protein